MILRSVLVSRTKHTASDATRAGDAQSIGESTSDLSPHGALGGFALATATFVASTPTSTSGVGRLGDGGRGATKRRGEAVRVEENVPIAIGVGRGLRSAGGASEAGAEGAEGPEASTGRSSSPRDMRQNGRAEHQRERRAKNALRAKGRGDGRCSEQRNTKAKPLVHQNGEPPRAAGAERRAGEATGSQEKERWGQRRTRRPRARYTGDGRQKARRRRRAPNRG